MRGKAGWTDMHDELVGYRPIEGVDVPEAAVYLLADVSTGPETLGVRPNDAIPMIREAHRTPLTIDEGVALVTQFPDVFARRNAFQAVGSRTDNEADPELLGQQGRAAARLVLGRQPAHLARLGERGRTIRTMTNPTAAIADDLAPTGVLACLDQPRQPGPGAGNVRRSARGHGGPRPRGRRPS